MIVKGKRVELFIDADHIARVVDDGEDGVSVFYWGNPHQDGFNRDTFHDDGIIPAFLAQLRKDDRFTPLGTGRSGPAEYVNFSNVRRVILQGGTAIVQFADEQRDYRGQDYEAIAKRVNAIR